MSKSSHNTGTVNKSKYLLFVLEHFYPYTGGVERLFLQLLTGLTEQGYRVKVLTTRHTKGLLAREIINGIEVHRLAVWNRYLFTLLALPAVIRYARHALLIHTSTYNAALPACLAGWLTRKKVVITVHEVWNKLWFKFPWMSLAGAWTHHIFERLVIRLPYHHYIAVSAHTRDALLTAGVAPEKITLIYNGVDYDRLEQLVSSKKNQPSGVRFVYYGRLGHAKGVDLIIRGGDQFLNNHPEASIELIIPATPKRVRQKLEETLAASACRNRFLLSPPLPDEQLFERLLHATAVLIPSYNEGFCFAAAEAAALFIPMVVSDMGALKETAGGKVVAMADLTPGALCDAMDMACKGEWKVREVSRFPLRDQLNHHLTLYTRMVVR
jgi:glycosyltransferase involved in cell wall biosynthesis